MFTASSASFAFWYMSDRINVMYIPYQCLLKWYQPLFSQPNIPKQPSLRIDIRYIQREAKGRYMKIVSTQRYYYSYIYVIFKIVERYSLVRAGIQSTSITGNIRIQRIFTRLISRAVTICLNRSKSLVDATQQIYYLIFIWKYLCKEKAIPELKSKITAEYLPLKKI